VTAFLYKSSFVIIYLAMLLSLMSCNADVGHTINGSVLYTYNTKLQIFDFKTTNNTMLVDVDKRTGIRAIRPAPDSLSKIDEGKVLLANGTKPYVIQIYDIKDGGFQSLIEGQQPLYIPGIRKFIFKEKKPISDLFISDIDNPVVSKKLLIDHDKDERKHFYVLVSDFEFVFARKDKKAVQLVDARTGVTTSLAIPNCSPVLWRAQLGQLLCSKFDSHGYYFVEINNPRKIEPVDLGEHGMPSLYAGSVDALLYSVIRYEADVGEVKDLRVRYLRTGIDVLLQKDFFVSLPGRNVWIN